MGMYSVVWRRLLGVVSLSIGLLLGILILKAELLGAQGHRDFRALIMPVLLIAVGANWMRGKTVHLK